MEQSKLNNKLTRTFNTRTEEGRKRKLKQKNGSRGLHVATASSN